MDDEELVRTVVSSGYADSPVISDYRTFGFVASLHKPYRTEALQDVLGDLLG